VPTLDPRDAVITELRATIEKLTARVAELEAKLGQNSSNSSKPPSSDGPGKGQRTQTPSGRKAGGQPGHKGHSRELVPPEKVNETKPLVPEECDDCHGPLKEKTGAPPEWAEQMVDIPQVVPWVVSFVFKWRWCPRCEAWVHGKRPHGTPTGAFGSNLLVFISLLTGKFRLTKRLTSDLLSDLLKVELSVASVCKAEQTMSGAMALSIEEARAYVRDSDSAHLDETGWLEHLRRAWLWVAVAGVVTVFTIAKSRGSAVAKAILGADYTGFIITDRWVGYAWVDSALRQLCWAHLARDFQGMVDRDDVGAVFGIALLHAHGKMFKWWSQVKGGLMPRADFQKRMAPVQRTIERLLTEAAACAKAGKTAGMAKQILKLKDGLFTFVEVEGIEPTNNIGESAIRPAVIYRKGSFGTFSQAGSRYVERIMSVVQSCKAQKRDILQFLTDTLDAHLRGLPPPSLVPGNTHVRSLAS